MKLLFLGLLIISVTIICLNKRNKEGLSNATINKNEQNYIDKQNLYWNNRKLGSRSNANDFMQLTDNHGENDELSLDKKLTEKKMSAPTLKSDVATKIERCRVITNCKDLVDNGCGFCWYSNKFMHGDSNGPTTDVCPKKGWVPPGEKASYYCKKINEQKICEKVKNCGGMSGEASICGWCPTSNQALVIGSAKKVTENTIYRWKTGICKPLEDNNKSLCNNNTKSDCEALKGPDGQKSNKGIVKCYWEEKMNSKTVPKTRDVYWPKYNDDWKKCKKGVSKNLVQSESDFKPGLIPSGQCEKFKQEFPCMSPNQMTGPHSGKCLQNLWSNSGCIGNPGDQLDSSGFNRAENFQWWNSHSYSDVQNNMNSFSTNADSKDYSVAKKYTKACYGEDVDPCDPKFYPRPQECTSKLYNLMGGKPGGKLNPINEKTWPNVWVDARWKQQSTWSTNKYQDAISAVATEAKTSKALLRNNPRDYDKAIRSNMQIYGNKPAPPFKKPCWGDMLDIAQSLKSTGITHNKEYIDYSKAKQFIVLPNTDDINRIKNGELNVYKNRLYKKTFDNPNFPYWDSVWKYQDYWKSNWDKFKRILLKTKGIKTDGKNLLVDKKLYVAQYIPISDTTQDRNNIIISQQKYNNPDFPYALLINMTSN